MKSWQLLSWIVHTTNDMEETTMFKVDFTRTITRTMLLCSCLLVSGLVMGCQQDNVQAPQAIRNDPLAGGYPQNVVLNGLEDGVVIGKPVVEAATDAKPMRVTVPLRSVVDGTLRTQYQFIFLDDKGRPVRSHRENWHYQVLSDHAQVFLEGAALETDAVDWRLEVRPAQ
jgi:hypothetical protein